MTPGSPPNGKAFAGRIISVYIHEQYVYGTEENANVVPFRPKIRAQFSRNPWEDIRFRRHARIYIIIERKERFPSSTDCFLLRPTVFYTLLVFRPELYPLYGSPRHRFPNAPREFLPASLIVDRARRFPTDFQTYLLSNSFRIAAADFPMID